MFTRNFSLILLGNIVQGSAMPMLIILGGLTGAWLAPHSWLATAPISVQMIAAIIVSTPISLFMGRFGRRLGFLLGAALIVVGGVLSATAIYTQSFLLLCAGHAALGAALVCVNYFRFAAAEAVAEHHRAQAISFTLASGLVAALVGPEVFSLSKDLLAPIPMAGAYLAIAGLGVVGAVPVLGLNMPSPRSQGITRRSGSGWRLLADNPKIAGAIGVAALAHAMMVLLMTPTPLAMVGCGFVDDQAADVVRWHVIAMFAPGFFTGNLIQRFGAGRIAALGIVLLFRIRPGRHGRCRVAELLRRADPARHRLELSASSAAPTCCNPPSTSTTAPWGKASTTRSWPSLPRPPRSSPARSTPASAGTALTALSAPVLDCLCAGVAVARDD